MAKRLTRRSIAPGYVTIARLHRGEQLDVYDAWSEERQSRCVVKIVRPEHGHDTRAVRHLLREGYLLRRLSHPHIVRCYEVRRAPRPLVVLETLGGATLARLIHDGVRLESSDLLVLARQLVSAIGYLHRRSGVLHLDLKPSNIVADAGRAKLIDLGIARRPGIGRRGVGSPGYLSPEQANGAELTEKVDSWGIGIVLYEAATGTLPFPGNNGSLSSPRVAAVPIRDRIRLPVRLGQMIDACLSTDPADRPSIEELASIVGHDREVSRHAVA